MYKPSQHTSKQKWWFDFGPKKRTRAVIETFSREKNWTFLAFCGDASLKRGNFQSSYGFQPCLLGGRKVTTMMESQWLSWIYPFPDFLVANKGWDMFGFPTLYWESCHPGRVDGIPGGWGVNPMTIIEMLWFSHLTSNCTRTPYENEAFATWNCKKSEHFLSKQNRFSFFRLHGLGDPWLTMASVSRHFFIGQSTFAQQERNAYKANIAGTKKSSKSGWWFQPIWKILVKMGIFPKVRGEHKKCFKNH